MRPHHDGMFRKSSLDLRNKLLKILSFINEADVIRKILEHLNLWEEKTPVERAPPDLIREKSCGTV